MKKDRWRNKVKSAYRMNIIPKAANMSQKELKKIIQVYLILEEAKKIELTPMEYTQHVVSLRRKGITMPALVLNVNHLRNIVYESDFKWIIKDGKNDIVEY